MATLIISEKPNACKKIVEAIAKKFETKRVSGTAYYSFDIGAEKYYAIPAVGHLFNLSHKPGATFPIFDIEWKPSHQVQKSAAFTKKYLKNFEKIKSKVDKFIVATDYDIEGSVIAYSILKNVYGVSDAERMKFSTLTKDELKDSFEKRNKHIDKGHINAGLLRHVTDYFWGVNSSRALMNAIKSAGRFKLLSIGRVQGPTLKILNDRELEIKSFKPKKYYELSFEYNGFKAMHPKRINSKAKAQDLFKKVNTKKATVSQINKSQQTIQPPEPFNLTTLQTTAHRVFGFTPAITLNLAQTLYEKGLISYPRTSSQKLPKQIGYDEILRKLSKIGDYTKFCKQLLDKKELNPKQGKKEDSAHPAIYPTGQRAKISEKEHKLYDLITRRFIACFNDNALKELLKLVFDVDGVLFDMTGHSILEKGFLECYGKYYGGEDKAIPPLAKGQEIKPDKYENEEKETKPPTRYSQASIISKMDAIDLGTKATRTNILKTLYDRDYILDASIQVTELGSAVVDVLNKYAPNLISIELTSEMEKNMNKVELGELKKDEVLEKSKLILKNILNSFDKNAETIGKELLSAVKDDSILGTCPSCNSGLRILYSRRTRKRFVGCTGYPNCTRGYPLPQSGLIKNLRKECSECKSPTILVIRKQKRPWKLCINPECPTKEDYNKKYKEKEQ